MGRGETIARCGELRRRRVDGLRILRRPGRGVQGHSEGLSPQSTRDAPRQGRRRQRFRDVQSAFEVLREFYDRGRVITFRSEENNQTSTSDVFQNAADSPPPRSRGDTQSYDYYAEAAEEDVPTYRVEPAKSDRSTCTAKHKAACGEQKIPKGALRVGQINLEAGSLHALGPPVCWRIPAKIWEGLLTRARSRVRRGHALRRMNRVLLCGMEELSEADLTEFVAYCTATRSAASRWRRGGGGKGHRHAIAATARRSLVPPRRQPASRNRRSTPLLLNMRRRRRRRSRPRRRRRWRCPETRPRRARAPKRPGGAFVIPKPGISGVEGCMAGLTCVSTGIFPEVGGSSGLNTSRRTASRAWSSRSAAALLVV